MVTFTLATPTTTGELGSQKTVTSLQIAAFGINFKPEVAALGEAEMHVAVTDPKSGYLQRFQYKDKTIPAFWASTPNVPAGLNLGDALSEGIFQKLLADGKIPAGTISHS